jgi:glycosyltransferase involved in cell wall biosynthesis
MSSPALTPGLAVSLVVPVRNEDATISELLASILCQTFPPREVIFVDGGSVDRTVQILRDMSAGNFSVRVREVQDAGPGRGRNVGIEAAANDWIALTDAGVHLEPDWLQCLVAQVERDPSIDVVFGAYEAQTPTFFQQSAAAAYVAPRRQTPGGRMRGPSIASCLIRRSLWRAVGGFPDLRAAEDLIFIERCEQAGRTAWAPLAMVKWQIPPSLTSTFRRFALYSYHNVLAGRERFWHYGIARQYLLGLMIVTLAVVQNKLWLSALPLAAVARTVKAIWKYDETRRIAWLFNPFRVISVGMILVAIDLATFVGWGQALWHKLRNA